MNTGNLEEKLKERVRAASGTKKAELVLKNARIINVFTETVQEADIAIEDGYIAGIGIYEGIQETDLHGRYVCPGFIDGHIHLESSMVAPQEFEKAVLPHGTTAVVTDPHEITNVAGRFGLEYMLKATEDLTLDVFFMLPSCVPSTRFDETGAVMTAEDLAPFYSNDRVLGLAEMMNFYGTVGADHDCLEKIAGALAAGRMVDGHAPMISGNALNAYIAANVASDHECSSHEEAIKKLERGQWIMIREGTAAKNLEALIGLFEPPYHQRAMLVTDDKHPGDLLKGGHIDAIIRRAVKLGADPVRAIKMGTYNAASYFGLKGRGAAAPGYLADLVILDSIEDMIVSGVYKNGKPVIPSDSSNLKKDCRVSSCMQYSTELEERIFHSFHLPPITCSSLKTELSGTRQRVIDLVDHELSTTERITDLRIFPGVAPGVDLSRDIVKLAVFERHRETGHAGLGFLGRYGLKRGAVATSVGHDSHNLVIAGVTDEDMAAAGNRVIQNEGGLAIALDGEILADLPLPAAGLMSELSLEETDQRLKRLKEISHELGISGEIDAFMTLAFVSLPVIPALRISTRGVVDVDRQQIVKSIF